MPWFWKPYTSDVTAFIDELKASKPTLEDEQRRGRAIWWDRRIDLQAEHDYQDARVPQPPYVYLTRQR
jgi:hypothetical protein